MFCLLVFIPTPLALNKKETDKRQTYLLSMQCSRLCKVDLFQIGFTCMVKIGIPIW